MHHSLQKEFSSSWSQDSLAIVTANLTLEEGGNIRKVHANAEIESLPVDCSIKQDVVAGKTCFQCMKTKFGFFCRRKKCPVCSEHVCSRCLTKVSVTPCILLSQSSRGP